MGSLVPFQDLNLQPETTNFTSSPNPNPRIFPKIEPKLEPLDEYTQADLQTPPIFPNPSPNFYSGAGSAFSRNQQFATFGSQSPSSIMPEIPPGCDGQVYSEFNRISGLFKEAFARRMQRYGDVEVVGNPNDDSAAVEVVGIQDEDSAAVEVVGNQNEDSAAVEMVEDPDSRAIVPVGNNNNQVSEVVVPRRKYQQRSAFF